MKTKQWKSYAELAETQEYTQWVEDEFPNRATLLDLDRRDFLKLTGAGMALAGLSGCRIMPHTKSVPYVRAPEQLVPGQSLYYATTLESRGLGIGVLVRSYEGRPVKIEGNPEHPSSLGATDVWTQAELLSLYDPNRAQSVIERGEVRNWDQFLAAARPVLQKESATGGAGIRIVTPTVVSPTYAAQLGKFLAKYPSAKWVQWEPLSQSNVRQGTALAFGKPLNPVYHLEGVKTVLSLDADFLLTLPGSVRYAREWANGRRVRQGEGAEAAMNRLYTVESSYTLTGASSDHRIAVKPTVVELVARVLHARITGGAALPVPPGVDETFLVALAEDLKAGGVVIPGDEQSPAVHAIAQAINVAINAVGKGVTYHAPYEAKVQDQVTELKQLANDLQEGKVSFLLTLGGNPVYDAPADLKLRDAYLSEKCALRAHLAHYADETAEVSHWLLPASHGLESWGDLKAHDGTIGLQQPLVEPLYETRTPTEVLTLLLGQPLSGMELLRQHYASLSEPIWRKAVHDGVVSGSAAPAVAVTVNSGLASALPPPPASPDLEVNFRPDPTIWDGRYAANTWLQELPKPLTTIVWDNAALVSPKTAKKLGLIASESNNDAVNIAQYSGKKLIEVTVNGATVKVAAWVQPGQPDDTITLYLGYGRTQGSPVCEKQGFNVYPLRASNGLGHVVGATVKPTNEGYELAFTQPHHLMRSEVDNGIAQALHINERENRDLVRAASIAKFNETKGHIHTPHHAEPEREGVVEEHGEHGGEEHEVDATALPTVVADDAFGLGRKHWLYVDQDPKVKTETNRDGNLSVYPDYSRKGYNAWAMSIDLTTCIGCNACTIACQAENNIPTVGKDQVAAGREMHWIRIDHYFESADLENVESHFMPVPCMQCEKAPCEPVCPVAATVHSHEGLNQMVYNRCVGTRYCSNNCPYKVRRFNFLKWTQGASGPTTLNFFEKPVLKMLPNPDVTLRGRGVMEKCTYCVQRINEARIEAKKEAREIQDGEIITACQQVCPTQAIVFGDINNPKSKVSLLKKQPHDYALLPELNTRPRTTYLAKIKNPNPALVKPGAESAAEGGH